MDQILRDELFVAGTVFGDLGRSSVGLVFSITWLRWTNGFVLWLVWDACTGSVLLCFACQDGAECVFPYCVLHSRVAVYVRIYSYCGLLV